MAKELAVGLKQGYVVSKIEVPSRNKKSTNPRKRVSQIRRVISEIAGRSPYEKRIIELIRQGKAAAGKKAYKLAKKALGTHRRASRKRNELTEFVNKSRQ